MLRKLISLRVRESVACSWLNMVRVLIAVVLYVTGGQAGRSGQEYWEGCAGCRKKTGYILTIGVGGTHLAGSAYYTVRNFLGQDGGDEVAGL